MTFVHRLLGRESRDLSFQDVWGRGADWFGGMSTPAGITVNDRSAMSLSAVYGSHRIINEGVSFLPVTVERPVPWLERPRPGQPNMTIADVIGQNVMSLMFRGNGYTFMHRDPSTLRVVELEVLDPDAVEIVKDAGRVRYKVNGTDRLFSAFEIAHVPGMMMPGSHKGLAPLDYARETIGLGLAAQRYGGGFFGNGANPSGIIEVRSELSDDEASFLRRQFEAMHKGAAKAQGVAVLTEGASYKPISLTPEQGQFLETRQFQVSDIARFYGVPPHLLQDASGSTSWGSGLAEQSTNFSVHTLRPWVERVESLLTWITRTDYPRAPRVQLSMDHLLRGDVTTRIDTASRGVQAGLMTQNEARQWVDPKLAPVAGGDALLAPLNLAPVSEGVDDED